MQISAMPVTRYLLPATLVLLSCLTLVGNVSPAFADNCCPPRRGTISGRSVVAGVASFFVWPGIGQAINDQKGDKVLTHVLLGLLPPYRFWSGYDGLVDRDGGYWDGRI
ncbi:MAG: hypothetical protein SFZ03_08565 [Candidatus Melainabacteria bacterium]|nr:hypothetical protein [Candidatus Melainabacteria bacterium]